MFDKYNFQGGVFFSSFFLLTTIANKILKNQQPNQSSTPESKKVHFINRVKLDTCQNTFVLKITIHTLHFPA